MVVLFQAFNQENSMAEMKTNKKILNAAQDLLSKGGANAVSFDKVAAELGITKQAVLYWFPSKSALLAAMFIDWLDAEAQAAEDAVKSVKTANEAIGAFVTEIVSFHAENFDRFRMMYLAPQTLKVGSQVSRKDGAMDEIHQATSKLYSYLAEKLDGSAAETRQTAFVIHTSVLGLVMMLALADSVSDPLAHSESELVNSLVARLIT